MPSPAGWRALGETTPWRTVVTAPAIHVYGAEWCGDCHRARRFLDSLRIPYQWTDVDRDPEALAYVRRVNQGRRVIPVMVFPDGSLLVEPGNAELWRKLRELGLAPASG